MPGAMCCNELNNLIGRVLGELVEVIWDGKALAKGSAAHEPAVGSLEF